MGDFVRGFYFSVQGRTSRRIYWLFGFAVFFTVGVLLGIGIRIVGPYLPPLSLVLFILVFAFFAVWCSVAVHAKRLHDIGVSAWWMIAAWVIALAGTYFVSVLVGQLSSLIIWMVIGAIPGTRGANK